MSKTMKNRDGTEYRFIPIGPSGNTYKIAGDLQYWRWGGREGQQEMDHNDLGFVDPAGGPFLSIGSTIEGRKIVQISAQGRDIYFKVE